jgi:hypothetical protein
VKSTTNLDPIFDELREGRFDALRTEDLSLATELRVVGKSCGIVHNVWKDPEKLVAWLDRMHATRKDSSAEYHRMYRLRLLPDVPACPESPNTSEMEKEINEFWNSDCKEATLWEFCEFGDSFGYTVFATDKGQLGVGQCRIEPGDIL